MNLIDTVEILIWNRKFTIPVEYDCYPGETVTVEQIDTLQCFLAHPEWIEKARVVVKEFCKKDVEKDEENTKKDNIFSYVKPEYFFVKRDADNPRIAMICRYRYDPEHGLIIVFSNDGSIIVGNQDIVF